MTSSMTLIADLAPPGRRAEAVGIYGTGGLIAVAVGPAVGEVILRGWGFPAFFAATMGAAAAACACAALVPAPPFAPAARGPAWGGRMGRFSSSPLAGLPVRFRQRHRLRLPAPFARALGLPRIGPFFIAYTGAAILVRFLGGGLADRSAADASSCRRLVS